MKRATAIFVNFCIPLLLAGQQSVTDSLLQVFNQSSDDSARVMTLCMISDEYSLSRADSAMYYAREALALATEKSKLRGQARALTRIGNLLKANGELLQGYETHIESLKISEAINDVRGIAASNSNIAEILKEQANFSHAMDYYWKANHSFMEIVKKLETAKPRNEDAIINNKSYLAITLLNIGDCYERMSKFDSALYFQEQAFVLSKEIGDTYNLGAIINNQGSIYVKKKMYDVALQKFHEAIPYLKEIDDQQFLANAYEGMSNVFLKAGQTDSPLFYARKSLSSAHTGSFTKEIFNAQLLLSSIFEARNATDSAFVYHKLATATKDSLFNMENLNKIQALNNQEQFRQLEIIAAKKKAEKERKDNLQMIAITIFIITFLSAVILLSRQKKKHRLIEYLGIVGLLLLFEFIALFIHPYIAHWTHHTPIYMLIILVGVAAILSPLHHRLTHWIKHSFMRHPTPHTEVVEEVKKKVNKPLQEKSPVVEPTLKIKTKPIEKK